MPAIVFKVSRFGISQSGTYKSWSLANESYSSRSRYSACLTQVYARLHLVHWGAITIVPLRPYLLSLSNPNQAGEKALTSGAKALTTR